MTGTDELAEMIRQYPHATLETHILDGNGEVRLRCGRCHIRPVPRHWQHLVWCDECLDADTAGRAKGKMDA